MDKKIEVLEQYIPKEAAPIIAGWIQKTGCIFRITKARNSKYGDYRPPFKDKGHRISVNHNLHAYAFLITTIHEFAHLKTWAERGRMAKPHGIEWKRNYQSLMHIFLDRNIFPPDLVPIIKKHFENPKASSCTDPELFKALSNYSDKKKNYFHLDELEINQKFKLSNGKVFIKMEKLRTRYRCLEVSKKQVYLIPGVAEVYLLEETA